QVLARHGDGEVQQKPGTRYLSVAAGGGSERLFSVFRELDEQGIVVDDIGMRRPTLDDVFLSLTGRVAETATDEAAETSEEVPA
ncbi:MAG: daunorubicin/doxorubicin resistance ABC transporter ATP-binding protein DrrA, partial [Candidatus Limnocylindrales bacterium]